jgi:hypothetical protein
VIQPAPATATDVTTTPIPEKKEDAIEKYGSPPESDDFEAPTQEELDALGNQVEKIINADEEENQPTIIKQPTETEGGMRGVFYYDKSLTCNVAVLNPSAEIKKFLEHAKWGYQAWNAGNFTASFVKPDQLEALQKIMPADKFKEVGWDEWSKGSW